MRPLRPVYPLFFTIIAVMYLAFAGAVPAAGAAELKGTVVAVLGETITIKLDSDLRPVRGDKVLVSFSTPGGHVVKVGSWRVTNVEGDRVKAVKVEADGEATLTMDAKIISERPVKGSVKSRKKSAPRDPGRLVRELPPGSVEAEKFYKKGYDYYEGKGDYRGAFEWFEKAARMGHTRARNYLGFMYHHGKGVERDYKEAVRLYRMGADEGNAYARSQLGFMYERGLGVEKDLVRAAALYRKAADGGNSTAQDNLGYMYQKGEGVREDHKEAVKWYRKSAEQGHKNGQNNLAYMYEKGLGVARDYALAHVWYGKSAAGGSEYAHWNLARMYEKGLGVAKDEAESVRHLKEAARGGHESSRKKLDEQGIKW